MRPKILIGAVAAVFIAFVIFGFGMQVGALNYGAGWWEPGMMMGGYGMGPGMIGPYGYAMGPWMMGPNAAGPYSYGTDPWMMAPYRPGRTALDLWVDDVKTSFAGWLAWQRNPRLKLGNVSEKDADTITVDILTTDKDGLVQRFAVDRHTGFTQLSED